MAINKFLQLNKDVKRRDETDHIILDNLWGDETFMCRFDKATDFTSIKAIELPSEFSAIHHKDSGRLEFIWATISKDNKLLSRKFKFYYDGQEFEALFQAVSPALELLARAFRETDNKSETDYRNLKMLRDFFREDTQTENMKRFFKDKTPTSFFINGDFSKINYEFVGLAKHLNFYMRYFDRRAPTILVFDVDKSNEKFVLPCHTETKSYPEIINTRKIDPVILDLLHISNQTTNIRLKYIFYYQILEYCSYYHLNEELKRKLNNVVKNPDVLNNSSHYSRLIIDEFKNYFKSNDDRQKFEKLILDYCDYSDIKLEIKCNHKYFSQDLTFDGWFQN